MKRTFFLLALALLAGCSTGPVNNRGAHPWRNATKADFSQWGPYVAGHSKPQWGRSFDVTSNGFQTGVWQVDIPTELTIPWSQVLDRARFSQLTQYFKRANQAPAGVVISFDNLSSHYLPEAIEHLFRDTPEVVIPAARLIPQLAGETGVPYDRSQGSLNRALLNDRSYRAAKYQYWMHWYMINEDRIEFARVQAAQAHEKEEEEESGPVDLTPYLEGLRRGGDARNQAIYAIAELGHRAYPPLIRRLVRTDISLAKGCNSALIALTGLNFGDVSIITAETVKRSWRTWYQKEYGN